MFRGMIIICLGMFVVWFSGYDPVVPAKMYAEAITESVCVGAAIMGLSMLGAHFYHFFFAPDDFLRDDSRFSIL